MSSCKRNLSVCAKCWKQHAESLKADGKKTEEKSASKNSTIYSPLNKNLTIYSTLFLMGNVLDGVDFSKEEDVFMLIAEHGCPDSSQYNIYGSNSDLPRFEFVISVPGECVYMLEHTIAEDDAEQKEARNRFADVRLKLFREFERRRSMKERRKEQDVVEKEYDFYKKRTPQIWSNNLLKIIHEYDENKRNKYYFRSE